MPSTHSASIPTFSSDNWAPAHPRVMEELARANSGAAPAYGGDPYTERAIALLKRHLGDHAIPYLMLTGTGTNVLALGSCVRPWEAVICPETAHIYAAETGAPEWHVGTRLLTTPSADGKLTVDAMRSRIDGIGNESRVQPRAVSITQATEYGTVYTPAELCALTDAAHAAGLYVHMDGARLANAAVALGTSLAGASSECGIDVLSFGATKNGAWCAEAVVFFDQVLADGFGYRRKQGMQLASKMRFIAAQLIGLLDDDTWLENARQANTMAARLAAGLLTIPGIELTQPVESNQVFVKIPDGIVSAMERAGSFHVWRADLSEYRLVCSFDQTADAVDAFLDAARREVARA